MSFHRTERLFPCNPIKKRSQNNIYRRRAKNNKRLKVLEESNDGFYITEKDYEMRGEGDLFGVKQSGDMTFKIANIKEDMKILLQAKTDVIEFYNANINNNFENYKMYANIIKEMSSLD